MLALVLVIAAASPIDVPLATEAPPRVHDDDGDDDDDNDNDNDDDDEDSAAVEPQPPLETPMWGPIDTAPAAEAPAPVTTMSTRKTGPDRAPLPLLNALGVMATATAVPVVVGATAGVVSLLLAAAIAPQLGYGILPIAGVTGAVGALLGSAAGAELGVALCGDPHDHFWVSLGAPAGAVVGVLLALSLLRGGLRVEPLSTLGASFALGSATGTGVVLLARHGDLPELP